MHPKLWSESLKERDLGIPRVGDGGIIKMYRGEVDLPI